MNLSQVLLAKSVFKARVKDIDLDDPYPREKVFEIQYGDADL